MMTMKIEEIEKEIRRRAAVEAKAGMAASAIMDLEISRVISDVIDVLHEVNNEDTAATVYAIDRMLYHRLRRLIERPILDP